MHTVQTSVPLPTPVGPTTLGPAQSNHLSMGPMDFDPDPTGGWSGVPITTKLTQGQKRALKVKQRAELEIPPRGFRRGSSSNQFTVIANSSQRKKKLGDVSDSTDDVSDDDPDPVLSAALRSQRAIPETPVSQILSLPSSEVPDHEQTINVTPSPEHDTIIVEVFAGTSLKPVDDLPLNELGLINEDEPKDDSSIM